MNKNTLKDLTVQELADLYDKSTKKEKQWMHDNIHLWSSSKKLKKNPKINQLKNKNIALLTKASDDIVFVTKT